LCKNATVACIRLRPVADRQQNRGPGLSQRDYGA
jgi:hypothetical protein